jgi:hypothetical protein
MSMLKSHQKSIFEGWKEKRILIWVSHHFHCAFCKKGTYFAINIHLRTFWEKSFCLPRRHLSLLLTGYTKWMVDKHMHHINIQGQHCLKWFSRYCVMLGFLKGNCTCWFGIVFWLAPQEMVTEAKHELAWGCGLMCVFLGCVLATTKTNTSVSCFPPPQSQQSNQIKVNLSHVPDTTGVEWNAYLQALTNSAEKVLGEQ